MERDTVSLAEPSRGIQKGGGAPGGGENNKGRPGSVAEDKHSLSLPVVASDGTRIGEPYGTIYRNPEERRTTPWGGVDNKERPVS